MCAVVTVDGNHVIVVGVEDYKGNDIYVLNIKDIEDVILNKSIKCPKHGVHHLLKTGDIWYNEMLVTGYIKSLFDSDEFKEINQLPMEILNMIIEWNYDEMIHWIEWNDKGEENEHYEIAVSTILSNLSN